MRTYIIVLMLCFTATITYAQWGEEELVEKPSFKDRIFTGGGLGASFSSYYSFVSVSPMVGVRVTQRLATGVQLTYRYSKYKYSGIPDFSTHDYGVSPFVRFQVYGPFFLHGEYEYLNYEYRVTSSESRRRGFSSVMAGGGRFQPIGRRAGFFLLALYNFSYGQDSPYDSPLVLRAGITAGF